MLYVLSEEDKERNFGNFQVLATKKQHLIAVEASIVYGTPIMAKPFLGMSFVIQSVTLGNCASM